MIHDSRYKIALYDPYTLGLGGLYRYVQGVIRELDPELFDVTVFCHPSLPFEADGRIQMRPVLPATGHPFMGIGTPTPTSFAGANGGALSSKARGLFGLMPRPVRMVAGFARSAMRISRLFRGQGFDLVHTFETDADPATLGARLAGVPRVVYTYQVDSTYRSEAERRCLGNRVTEFVTDRCLTVGIAASERTRQDRLVRTRMPADRIVTIPNGIDTNRFRRTLQPAQARAMTGLPDDGRRIIGTVGRLHEHKGHEYLIRALAILARRDVHLVIVGSGALESELGKLADAQGVASQVTFLGQRSDVLELLQAFDVMALPSLCEALPYALLEAMSVGIACVATDVGGVAELIDEGKSGFVVPAKDPRLLADRLRILLDSPERRAIMASAARARVASAFHEQDRIKDTVRLYKSILETGIYN